MVVAVVAVAGVVISAVAVVAVVVTVVLVVVVDVVGGGRGVDIPRSAAILTPTTGPEVESS